MPAISVGQTLSESARTSANQYDLIISVTLNSQSITNNTSNITVALQLKSNYAYFQQYQVSGTTTLTGASPGSYSGQYSFPSLYSTITLKTWTGNVTHESNGSYTTSAAGTISSSGTYGTGTGSVTLSNIVLPTIPRASVLGTIPSFTFDGNSGVGVPFSVPVTKYYSGFYNILAVSLGGTTIYSLDNYNGNTITLPTYAVNAAYGKMTSTNSSVFTFVLTTYSNSSKSSVIGTSSKTATGSISAIGRSPTFSVFTYEDINPETLGLTGSSATVISGQSAVLMTVSSGNRAIANKGATMVRYEADAGGSVISIPYSTSTVSATDEKPQRGTIIMTAIDSRSNSTSVALPVSEFVNYTPLVFVGGQAARALSGAGSAVTLQYNGTYSSVDFGSVQNNIVSAQYRYKRTSATTYGTWYNLTTPFPYGNTWSASGVSISGDLGAAGFDINYSYHVQIEAFDYLSSQTLTVQVNAGSPIMALNKRGASFGKPYATPGILDSAWAISAPSASLATPLPVTSGGTGATIASNARINLGITLENLGLTISSGAWTPVFRGLNGATITYSSTLNNAGWLRMGNMVFIYMRWRGTITNIGTSDYATIRGIPFTIGGTGHYPLPFSEHSGAIATNYPLISAFDGYTYLRVQGQQGTGAVNFAAGSSSTKYLSFGGWYPI